jgi:GGDEF domain-containing protein
LSTEAKIVVRCAECRRIATPETTAEHLVHAYELTPRADEAVASGSLATATLESVLARKSGVCTKALLLFELDRELARRQRYESPAALLMVRIEGMDALRAAGSSIFVDHLERVCLAITSHLRNLDLLAIWSDNTVVMLLPETPIDGANIVASRMESGIAAISPAHATLRAHITIAQTDPAFASAAAMIEACTNNDTAEAVEGSVATTTDISLNVGFPPSSASDSQMPVVVMDDDTQTIDNQLPNAR